MPTSESVRNSLTFQFCKATLVIFGLLIVPAAAAFGQTFTVLYTFTGGADGSYPVEGLVRDSAGNLYGTANAGGTGSCDVDSLQGCGTVYRVSPSGTETVLHDFQGGSDGSYPWGSVGLDNQGTLFGTTTSGGLGFGVVFNVNKNGSERIIHRFTGKTDGASPYGNLVPDRQGNLYGTSSSGGDLSCGSQGTGCGTLFKLSKSGEAIVHRFAGAPSDGNFPADGALLIDGNGNLYGTTAEGGTANYGTVYKIDQNGNYSVLYSFAGGNDGCEPFGTLAIDKNGNLYGTASVCGSFNKGTIFKVNPAGSVTVLYAFSGINGDGNSPFGGVTRDQNGNLYGTTLFGGSCTSIEGGCGTVFKLGPNGNVTILHSFDDYTDGFAPWSNVILDAGGNLYGTASNGGANGAGAGTVWKIAP